MNIMEKRVGRWEVKGFSDGWPMSAVVNDTKFTDNPFEQEQWRMTHDELKDLIYALQRIDAFFKAA